MVSAIPSQGTLELEDTLIPWMLTRSIPSRLARNEGHRVHGMVGLITVEHIFHETAKHAKATAGNHLAEANRASHGPRVLAKESARRVLENPKKNPNPKMLKVRTRVKLQKLIYLALKNRSQRQIRNLRNRHSVGWHEGWEQTYDTTTSPL